MDSFEDNNDSNLRQRLWGGAVFVAIMVIVLPFLLDGSGSESQFRRVEKLRQEPPSIIDPDGQTTVQSIPELRSIAGRRAPATDSTLEEDGAADSLATSEQVRESLRQTRQSASLTAWVVQAGSFQDQDNAIAVRNLLRRSGFASFVRDREAITDPFRVLVGPMITEQSANKAREQVESLLGREALVVSYP